MSSCLTLRSSVALKARERESIVAPKQSSLGTTRLNDNVNNYNICTNIYSSIIVDLKHCSIVLIEHTTTTVLYKNDDSKNTYYYSAVQSTRETLGTRNNASGVEYSILLLAAGAI